MLVSQKSQYALRAIFELARHYEQGPVKIAEIARAQAIPPRFLEVILSQLKQAGFVESRRGNEGGYLLRRDPETLSVREVIEFVQGPVGPIECVVESTPNNRCPLHGDCVFMPMWNKVKHAILDIYESTTFANLLQEEKNRGKQYIPCYSI